MPTFGSAKIELTNAEGVRYVIELEELDLADLTVEREEHALPTSGAGAWREFVATEYGSVRLATHGKIVKMQRLAP